MSGNFDVGDVLSPLTGEIKPSRYAVVDIETKDGETQQAGFTRPFLAGFYDGDAYFQTKGRDCLTQMTLYLLTKEHEGMSFYAHHGGGFDWLHMLPVIKALGYYFEIMTVSSSIQMMVVKRHKDDHGAGWRFLDSLKLLPISLKEACRAMQTTAKLSDHDLNLHENAPAWGTYLKTDCVALYEVLERFHHLVEIQLCGEVGITAASTAMKTFRRGYQSTHIQRNCEHHSFFRNCLYGGRTERFRESGEGLHYYDINSAYPHAMLSPMPVGAVLEWKNSKPSNAVTKGRVGFAWARVEIPESVNIPPLPVHDDKTGRLIFPVGRLQGYWAAIELERAEEMGATVHWDRSLWVDARPALADYVRSLYVFRDKSREDFDEGLALTAKLLLNSLYGKFGMAHEREKIIIVKPGDSPPAGSRAAAPLNPDCEIWHVKEDIDAPYIIPQISAYITAIARLNLHSILLEADKNGGLVYCDTDSVLTTRDLSHLCGHELGQIKDEGNGDTFTGEFLLPKLYCLINETSGEAKIAMKGYEKDGKVAGKRAHTVDLFRRVKAGETITFKRLEKVGTMARKQFSEGPQMNIVKRQLRAKDVKRTHFDGLLGSKPLYREDW